jgi:antitoxin HicB
MTDTAGERPQYSMVIQWDPHEGGYYVVSFPEWEAVHYRAHEFGATYEEAAAKGRDLLEFLIQSAREEGEQLPAPRLFADANANAPAGA